MPVAALGLFIATKSSPASAATPLVPWDWCVRSYGYLLTATMWCSLYRLSRWRTPFGHSSCETEVSREPPPFGSAL